MAITIFFFVRCRPKLRFYAWLGLAYTFVVSFSIVYLGEHWMIDVLGGWLAAGATAWLCASERMHRVYVRIPGDPLGRVFRINAQICAPGAKPLPELGQEEGLEPLPQAA